MIVAGHFGIDRPTAVGRTGKQLQRSLSVDRAVASALDRQGADGLYQHQVETVQSVRNDRNTVITTPTASGKSLAYIIPVLERAADHGRKALYVHRTER